MKNETRKEQKKDTKKPEVRTRAVEELRLNKFISHNSNYSRREADALIAEGKVKVNNRVITDLATKVKLSDKVEIGKKRYYFIDDAEKDRFVTKAKDEGKAPVINRFKDLGEMNPEQLWDTTMDPKNRVLKQVSIVDGEEAEKVFEMLMGAEVPPRRRFIQTYAKNAILDV